PSRSRISCSQSRRDRGAGHACGAGGAGLDHGDAGCLRDIRGSRSDRLGNLAHPGNNMTGVTMIAAEVTGKRLDLLKQALPKVSRVAVLWNPANQDTQERLDETRSAARALGIQIGAHAASAPAERPGPRRLTHLLLPMRPPPTTLKNRAKIQPPRNSRDRDDDGHESGGAEAETARWEERLERQDAHADREGCGWRAGCRGYRIDREPRGE